MPLTPCPELERDKDFTRRMFHAAVVVGIDLVDHLVIGQRGAWASTAEQRRKKY
jgi:DNA repair protein RadC